MSRAAGSFMACLALAACGAAAGPAEPAVPACEPRDSRCQRWLLVVQPGSDPAQVRAWLQAQGIRIERHLVDLRLVQLLLPAAEAGAALRQSIRQQPFTLLLTDEVEAQPGGAAGSR